MRNGKLKNLALLLAIALAVVGLVFAVAGCGSSTTTTTAAPVATTQAATTTSEAATTTTAAVAKTDLVLASTTSTKDSGLFDVLIPAFEKDYPMYNTKVVAVGSGEALKMGETGDADVLLVHSPAAEEKFMADGFGVDRHAVMYNDFIIVGPTSDPAGIKGMTVAADAFTKIADTKSTFFTRGDDSGTHAKELTIWKAAGIIPSGDWYVKTGQGMGETLTVADQKSGYTLSDRATYLAKKDSLPNTVILVEGDKALFNQYHVITVKGAKNAQGATDFYNWIITPPVQKDIIGTYGVEKYGQAALHPQCGYG